MTATGGSTGAAGTCGNGKLDPGEFCDGATMQSATCAMLGFSGGSVACSSSCQFDVSSCTGGALAPTVTASRTSCAAPCEVFFDATATSGLSGGDFVGANWTWDFNDPASPHKGTIGFNVAHVFDSPGTYHVTTRVRDIAGSAGKTTTTITVSAMSGTSYYVASSGSDSNNGLSTSAPFLTVAHALSVGSATNNSILLRRGDTFTIGSGQTTFSTPGPFRIGAYTDPGRVSTAAPIWSSSSTGGVIGITGADFRMTDIHVTATAAAAAGIANNTSTNTLLERVEVQGGGTGWNSLSNVAAATTYFSVFDCNLHDFNGYGLYGQASGVAFVGTSVTSYDGIAHAIRLQGPTNGNGTAITHSYIAENRFVPKSTATAGYSDVTIRGDNSQFVVVNNYFDAGTTSATALTFQPSSSGAIEHVQDGLAEGNTICNAGSTPFSIFAKHIYVRNNVFTANGPGGPDQGVYISAPAGMPANWTDQIVVNNNTQYVFYSGTHTSPNFLISKGGTTGKLTAYNNILATGNQSAISSVVNTDNAGGGDVFDYNLIYAPNAGGTIASPGPGIGAHGINNQNPMFVSTTVGGATAFRLQSASPARSVGTSVPDYQDSSDVIRAKEMDIGAFEYSP